MKEIDQKVLTHWVENLINAIRYYRTGDKKYKNKIKIDGEDCAWCKKYFMSTCCKGCPIFEVTQQRGCNGTNWLEISNIVYEDWDDNGYQLVKEIAEFYNFLKKIILENK